MECLFNVTTISQSSHQENLPRLHNKGFLITTFSIKKDNKIHLVNSNFVCYDEPKQIDSYNYSFLKQI